MGTRSEILASMVAGLWAGGTPAGRSSTGQRKRLKPCLNEGCNKQHDHNNVCCSAKCFKEYKEEKNG